jgi:hypothetical protein
MGRKAVRSGWVLVALGVIVPAFAVAVGTLRARGDESFNHWVGWANVWALVIGAIGVVLVLWEKIFPGAMSSETDLDAVALDLAEVVLAEAQDLRSRLIGPGEAEDRPANVRFLKGSGRFREAGGIRSGDLESVLGYYRSLDPGRMVVLGDPGTGKTVLAVDLQVRLLEWRERAGGGQDTAVPVPILISAAAYDTTQAWPDWLSGHLALRYAISKAIASRLIQGGYVLPLVDGLDEMDPDGDEPVRAKALVAELNTAMRGTKRAPLVATCRHAEYAALRPGLDRATHVEMTPLTGGEAAEYLLDHLRSEEEIRHWKPVLDALETHPEGVLADQLATPWRLTLALAAFRDDGDPATMLAASATGYPNAVGDLLLGHYISAAVRLYGKAGRYRVRDVQRWLVALAQGLARQAREGGSATDIELARWWEPVGTAATRFGHVAVIASVGLLWPFFFTGLRPDSLDSIFPHDYIPEDVKLSMAGFLAILVNVMLAALAGRSPEPVRLSIRKLATPRGMTRLILGFAIFFGLGFAGTFIIAFWSFDWISELAGAPEYNAGIIVASGAMCGLLSGLAGGVLTATADNDMRHVRPRDVLRADGWFTLTAGLIFGSLVAATFSFMFTLQYVATGDYELDELIGSFLLAGLVIGFPTGILAGLAGVPRRGLGNGSSAWFRYYLAVLLNAARRSGPLRFAGFLDWAHDAGLLRTSGTAYQFRHRQLQDWLASQWPNEHETLLR